ncbi:MAG: dihydrodipicolinate reductase [Acidimicrobiales bacterium]
MSMPLRVVQWATGNIGTRSLRAIIEHPDLELVGVHVHADDKVGKDAGELCGAGRTGVLATGSIDEVLALAADCVLYMPQGCDFDDVCRMLASGTNIVTTRGEFVRPASMDPEVRRRVEDACAEGGTSIHATGSSPGFISEALPIVLLTMHRRLDLLQIDEFADMSSRDSPELLFELMGFGGDPAAFDARRFGNLAHAFGPSLSMLADAIGLPIDAIESSGEVAVAAHDVEIAAGTVEAGTVAAQRPIVTALRDGEPLMRFRANWYVTTDVEPAWDLRETGWRVQALGDTPIDLEIRFPVDPAHYAEVSPGFTAHPAVNAVATVCAAAPGIRTTFDLPKVIPQLG